MPDAEFEVLFGSDHNNQFDVAVNSDDQEFTAELNQEEHPFEATMSAEEESFSADLSDDDSEFDAEFGSGQQIHTERVRSVNGMVGDVILPNPSINSVELIGNRSFGQLGVHIMTNMELENILSD